MDISFEIWRDFLDGKKVERPQQPKFTVEMSMNESCVEHPSISISVYKGRHNGILDDCITDVYIEFDEDDNVTLYYNRAAELDNDSGPIVVTLA